MNTQKIKAGNGDVKDAIMDIEGIANIDRASIQINICKIYFLKK